MDTNNITLTEGQLVKLRNRRFVVNEIDTTPQESGLLTGQSAQHLITLTSVDDDASGEVLRVIWEVEPGTEIIEQERTSQKLCKWKTPLN